MYVAIVLALALGGAGCRSELLDLPGPDAIPTMDLAEPPCPDIRVINDKGQISAFDSQTLRFTDLARAACFAPTVGVVRSIGVDANGPARPSSSRRGDPSPTGSAHGS